MHIARLVGSLLVLVLLVRPANANQTWYFDDAGATMWWGNSYTPPPEDYWEPMGPSVLSSGSFHDLDVNNPYWGATSPMNASFVNDTFEVNLWLANNWPGGSSPVTVELGYGSLMP
jgi:hypothetical protein